MELIKTLDKNITTIKFFKDSAFLHEEVPFLYPVITFGEIRLYNSYFIHEVDIKNLSKTKSIYQEQRIIGILENQIYFISENIKRNDYLNIYEQGDRILSLNIEEDVDKKYLKHCHELYQYYNFKEEGINKKIIYSSLDKYVVLWELSSKYSSFYPTGENYMIIKNDIIVLCHSPLTGERLWSFDATPYLLKEIPTMENGEPILNPGVDGMLYNQVYDTLTLFLYPDKLLTLDAKNGNIVWKMNYDLTNYQLHADEETGNIYSMQGIHDPLQPSCVYKVIRGNTGELLLDQDLSNIIAPVFPNGQARRLEYHHFAGYKGDSIYISLFGEGELYKLNKHTGMLEDSYIHDRNFESAPIIYKNCLFLTDPAGEEGTRLLVFEI